jgi:hypothetical protein
MTFMVESQPENWGVRADRHRVEAWSVARLQFEPRGWQVDLRNSLRSALRQLLPACGQVLHAEYEAPDRDFADLENVLLYNVGSGAYSHLVVDGVELRRFPGPDQLHRVSYEMGGATSRNLADSTVLAKVDARIGVGAAPRSAGTWWRLLRPAVIVTDLAVPHTGEFGVEIELIGVQGNRSVAGQLKPLLDGLISAFQVHHPAPARPDTTTDSQLALLGDPAELWDLLTDDSAAALGACSLIRPGKVNLVWNPSDHRCSTILLSAPAASVPRIRATVWAPP